MAIWRYIKGTEADFKGAPEWATHVSLNKRMKLAYEQDEITVNGNKYQWVNHETAMTYNGVGRIELNIIAQRERVTFVNDERLQTTVDKFAHLNDLPLVSEKYPSHDNVNHPPHYTQGGIECIDALRAATVGKTGIEAVCVANVIKYLWRYEVKGGVESIEKAQWYLNHLLEVKRGTQSD